VKFGNEIIAARKVLTELNNYFKRTKWKERLESQINPDMPTAYLQAMAVKVDFLWVLGILF
jgi:hypothetical protein